MMMMDGMSSPPPPPENNVGPVRRAYGWGAAVAERIRREAVDLASTAKKVGKEDPRRIVHGFKVAVAITMVSLFYYFQPMYESFGASLMWAIMTVVVVFEYSVGATLGKGINRMIATFLAGFLGTLAYHLADLAGNIGKPILLSTFCFIAAALVTFIRFFPKLKARYDYGLMIFMLTFSLVSISGYREAEVIKVAHQRLSTIIVGCFIAMIVCIFVSPVWNGAELQNLVSSNLDKLGAFLLDFGEHYFAVLESEEGKPNKDKSSLQKFKSILGSKNTEETMANLAAWEPPHGRFRFRHPWKQYLKVGTLARQCAYTIDSLNNHLTSNLQAPPEIRAYLQEACTTLSLESGKALKELASGMKKMKRPSSSAVGHVNKSKSAAEDLKSLLDNNSDYILISTTHHDLWNKEFNLLDLLPAVTVASLLIDVGAKLEEISDAVHELSTLAKFKPDHDHKAVAPVGGDDGGTEKVVVSVKEGGYDDDDDRHQGNKLLDVKKQQPTGHSELDGSFVIKIDDELESQNKSRVRVNSSVHGGASKNNAETTLQKCTYSVHTTTSTG